MDTALPQRFPFILDRNLAKELNTIGIPFATGDSQKHVNSQSFHA